jgi:uncharacterized protein (DUF2461 family)
MMDHIYIGEAWMSQRKAVLTWICDCEMNNPCSWSSIEQPRQRKQLALTLISREN